jgi:hypothetical protein
MFSNLFRKAAKAATKPNYRRVQSWDPLTKEGVSTVYASTARRSKTIAPTRKSIPLSPICGMPKGGCAEKLRKELTEFGSPWRGLTGIPQKLLWKIAGGRAAGVNIDVGASRILEEAGKYWGKSSSRFSKFAQGMEQAKRAGHETMIFMPTSKKNFFGKEVKISYSKEQFSWLKSTIRHERTHQFNVTKGPLREFVMANRLPPAAMEKLRSIGYTGQVYDEMLAMVSEVRYRSQFTKGSITELKKRSGDILRAYGDDVFMSAVKIARNEGIQLIKSRPDLYRRGRQIHRSDLHIAKHMQHTTEMVKANTTGMTVPGLAMSPRRGGSRQGPQGGT